MNTIDLRGTIVSQEDLRYSDSGLAIKDFTLGAIEQVVTSEKTIEVPWYHQVTFLGKAAEKYTDLEIGTGLLVRGAVEHNEWTNERNQKRSRVSVKGLLAVPFETEGRTRLDGKGQELLVYGTNRVSLIGNLTKDPETTFTKNNNFVANARIAVNDRWTDERGTHEKAHFIDVRLWGEPAGRMAKLSKGERIMVEGRLTTDNWEGEAGRQFKTLVEANQLNLILPKAA